MRVRILLISLRFVGNCVIWSRLFVSISRTHLQEVVVGKYYKDYVERFLNLYHGKLEKDLRS